jgi:hypothetical protein
MKYRCGDPLAIGICEATPAFEARHRRAGRGIAQAPTRKRFRANRSLSNAVLFIQAKPAGCSPLGDENEAAGAAADEQPGNS